MLLRNWLGSSKISFSSHEMHVYVICKVSFYAYKNVNTTLLLKTYKLTAGTKTIWILEPYDTGKDDTFLEGQGSCKV